MNAFRWALHRRLGEPFSLAGADAVDTGETPREEAIQALAGAFTLLDHVSPFMLRRVKRELRRYLLRDTAFPRYIPHLRCVLLGKDSIAQSNNAEIALILVHEATHARLERLGVRATRFGLERIEMVCMRRELALASHFPDSAAWTNYVESKINSRFWARKHIRERLERELLKSNFPPWVVKSLASFATRNHPD